MHPRPACRDRESALRRPAGRQCTPCGSPRIAPFCPIVCRFYVYNYFGVLLAVPQVGTTDLGSTHLLTVGRPRMGGNPASSAVPSGGIHSGVSIFSAPESPESASLCGANVTQWLDPYFKFRNTERLAPCWCLPSICRDILNDRVSTVHRTASARRTNGAVGCRVASSGERGRTALLDTDSTTSRELRSILKYSIYATRRESRGLNTTVRIRVYSAFYCTLL